MSDNIGSKYLQGLKEQNKDKVFKAFQAYRELLEDKTHPDNQTESYHKNAQGVINQLLSAAHDLDEVNPGEGIFGLFTLLLTTNLKTKNKLIELEVENNKLKRQLNKR